MIDVQPLDGFALVKPIVETAEASGIKLPENLQKNKNKAEVIAFSNNIETPTGRKSVSIPIPTGSTVYVADYIDKPIIDGEDKYFFVRYEDILGIDNVKKTV